MAGWLAETADGRFSYLCRNSDSDSSWGQSRLRVMIPSSSILMVPMSSKLLMSLNHARPGYLSLRFAVRTEKKSRGVRSRGIEQFFQDMQLSFGQDPATRAAQLSEQGLSKLPKQSSLVCEGELSSPGLFPVPGR